MDMQGRRTQTERRGQGGTCTHSKYPLSCEQGVSLHFEHHGRDVASKPHGTLNPAVPFSRQGQWSLEG